MFANELGAKVEAFFSMSFNKEGPPIPFLISQKIINKIESARKHIFIAIYTFTNSEIAQALIKQKEAFPELKIEVIVDKFSMLPSGKAKFLANCGIKVFLFEEKLFLECLKPVNSSKPTKIKTEILPKKFNVQSYHEPLMHNKYAIIDNCLFTGSYNFSVKADMKNCENLILVEAESVDEIQALEAYLIDFENIKKYTTPVKASDFVQITRSFKKKKVKLTVVNKKKSLTIASLGGQMFSQIKNMWDRFFI